MKQSKAKKSAAAASTAKQPAAQPLLPDAEYVAQLLAASTPESMAQASSIDAESEITGAAVAAITETIADAAPHGVEDTGTLSLDAQCLLRDATECRQRLLKRLDSDSTLIDVAAVERIDTAYMQVLLTFVRSRPATVAAVTWLNVNAVFLEAADALGLRAALGLPSDLSASAA